MTSFPGFVTGFPNHAKAAERSHFSTTIAHAHRGMVDVHAAVTHYCVTGKETILRKLDKRSDWDNEEMLEAYPQLLKISRYKNDPKVCLRVLQAACFLGKDVSGVFARLGNKPKGSPYVIGTAIECDEHAREYVAKNIGWLSAIADAKMCNLAYAVIKEARQWDGERENLLMILAFHDPEATNRLWSDRHFVWKVGKVVSLEPVKDLVADVFSRDKSVAKGCGKKWGPSIVDMDPGDMDILLGAVAYHPSAMQHSYLRDDTNAVIECLKVNSYSLHFADESVLVPLVYIQRLLDKKQIMFVIAVYFELDNALALILANFFAREHLGNLL